MKSIVTKQDMALMGKIFKFTTPEELPISFTDNGKGCEQRMVQALNSQFSTGRYIYKSDTETSSTIGLKNINERLRLIYGEEYHITVNSEQDNFFEVLIRLPNGKN